MQAKITWTVFLLMALGLAGTSRNFCGKTCRHPLSAAPKAISLATACTAEETDGQLPGFSPVNLFIFQFK
jgi:hypothetical protein